MINLLFTVVFIEMALVLILAFRTPIRKLLILAIDHSKRGRGPLVAKTVAATILVVFISLLYSVMDIRKRSLVAGAINPTEQVLMAERLLESSLIGVFLFLAMVIDRLHYYIKELYLVRKELEEVKKSIYPDYEEKRSWSMDESEEGKVKQPEFDSRRREKEEKAPGKVR